MAEKYCIKRHDKGECRVQPGQREDERQLLWRKWNIQRSPWIHMSKKQMAVVLSDWDLGVIPPTMAIALYMVMHLT